MSTRFDVVDWGRALPPARARRKSLLERQPIIAGRRQEAWDVSVRHCALRDDLLSLQVEGLIACVPLAGAVVFWPLSDRALFVWLWGVVGAVGFAWLVWATLRGRRVWRQIREIEDLVP